MNGTVFLSYVSKVLGPTPLHGDIVIMDNCPPTKPRASATRSKRRARVCSTCHSIVPTSVQSILPQAQDEDAFAKLKALLRAKTKRTIAALWDTAGSLLEIFTANECASYFKAARYELD